MRWVLTIGAAVALLDQATKWLVVRWLEPADVVVVIPGFFHLVCWWNPGAAWGMFRDSNLSNLALAIVSVITLAALILFRRALHLEHAASRLAIGLISGGIVGNLVDRVAFKSVIDFLDFHVAGHHWPAFNVADSAICVGVTLYILQSWWRDRRTGPDRGRPAH